MTVLRGKELAGAAKAAYDDAQSAIWFSTNKAYSYAIAAALPGSLPLAAGMGLARTVGETNWRRKDTNGLITQWAAMARSRHYGNCNEYTAIAFEYLIPTRAECDSSSITRGIPKSAKV